MPRKETKTYTVYSFNELSQEAKQKAIEEYNTYNNYVIVSDESFEQFLDSVGYENIKTYWSGFYSQGDGACFTFKNLDLDKFLQSSEGWGGYTELHNNFLTSYPKLIRQIKRIKDILLYSQSYSGRYYHSKSVSLNYDIDINLNHPHSIKHIKKCAEAFEMVLSVLNEELANLYYKNLQEDYEHQQSEESVSEKFSVFNYEFLECGDVYND